MEGVKVIGSTLSLFCTRVEWALKLKGVQYDYIKEDLRNKSPLLLTYNPVHKKVPVLLYDEKPVAESLVILEYIDETWNQNYPLLPKDPYEKVLARFWAKYSDEKVLLGAFNACCAEGQEKEKAIESATEPLALLEKQIEGKKFFGGEKIGFLDLAVGWIPFWLSVWEEVGGMSLLDANKFPCLHEWTKEFSQVPLIKECLPEREMVVNNVQGYVTYLRSLAAATKQT